MATEPLDTQLEDLRLSFERRQAAVRAVLGNRKPPPPQFLCSPISLPEATSGKLSIRHRVVTGSTPVIGSRQALLRGVRPVSGVLHEPLIVHELSEDDQGVWMTDLPEELNQIAEALTVFKPSGDVLVGGLGLGILPAFLVDCPSVSSVTVVERSADVINLCARDGYEVVHADIREYLQTCGQYDSWMLDTWQGTNEGTWWHEVLPLRRIIANRFGRQCVHCWAEDIMLGQVAGSAANQAGKYWYYKCLPENASPQVIRSFVRDVGLPAWEKKYGAAVDRILSEEHD